MTTKTRYQERVDERIAFYSLMIERSLKFRDTNNIPGLKAKLAYWQKRVKD